MKKKDWSVIGCSWHGKKPLLPRRYVSRENRNLYLTELGEVVNHMMKAAFPSIVESDLGLVFRQSGNPGQARKRPWGPYLITILRPQRSQTQPPAHYTEAALVKTLEELGIGRPSTYAPTITTEVSYTASAIWLAANRFQIS